MNISIMSDLGAQEENVKIDIQHISENNWNFEDGPWVEKEYNYRLNICSDIYYAVVNNQVVGHVGLYDDQVKALFVDEQFRAHGISYQLYEYLFTVLGEVTSDDAREPSDTHIWKTLKKKYPKQIKYDSKLDVFIFS